MRKHKQSREEYQPVKKYQSEDDFVRISIGKLPDYLDERGIGHTKTSLFKLYSHLRAQKRRFVRGIYISFEETLFELAEPYSIINNIKEGEDLKKDDKVVVELVADLKIRYENGKYIPEIISH